MTVALAQHSCATPEWGTPGSIVELARTVLGTIDLDPATSTEFNRRVRAARILTKDDDALSAWTDWACTPQTSILVNPPGGVKSGRSLPGLFWKRLMAERERGFAHAIWIGVSLEQLAVTQAYGAPMLQFPLCVPAKRLRFDAPDGTTGPQPTHANVIVYIPGAIDVRALFMRTFEHLGACAGGTL